MTNTFINNNNNNKDYNFTNINHNNNMPLTLPLSYLFYPKAWLLKSNNREMKLINSSKPRESNCGEHWRRRGRGITGRC